MDFYEIGLPQQSRLTCILKLLWIETLQKHLSSKPQLKAERFCFHKRNRLEVSTYVGELKKFTLYCESGASLKDALRDRLVYGLHNELIQKRLLSETELTLAKLPEIALAMEAAVKDTLELQGSKESGVYKVINGGNSASNMKSKSCGTTHKTALLKTYSGENIKPEKKLLVRVEHSNQVKNLHDIVA